MNNHVCCACHITCRGGDATFCQLSRRLAFGGDCLASAAGRIATVQTLSGTGALRVGAEFLKKHYAVKVVYLPDPTW
jgi:aspartate aminotransferase